ncbi:hypothetical protein ACFUNF_21615 [Streptomyces sp. NPDC057291]|uniref:hypothetical protein n=1 Tax=Streptomyces sp. NPDC057291 TaxID=3346087 RepID=UPI0036330561
MPRPLWTGAISFGLVTIPIKIISATEDRSLGKELREPVQGEEREPGNVVDLMAALNASVEAAKKSRGEHAGNAAVHEMRPSRKPAAKKTSATKTAAAKKDTARKTSAKKRSVS